MPVTRITATRVVAASPETVFGFLAKLENHWQLAGRWVKAIAIDDSSGRVRIHGPLGLRRTATTTVVDSLPSHAIHGTAELSGGTTALVAWRLNEHAGGTSVSLSADVERAALPDRLLLAGGGQAWMTRRFDAILQRLDEQFAR